jgi:hypothetical protein
MTDRRHVYVHGRLDVNNPEAHTRCEVCDAELYAKDKPHKDADDCIRWLAGRVKILDMARRANAVDLTGMKKRKR